MGLTKSRSTSSLAAASSLLDLASSGDSEPCGVGEWTAMWLGRADYLENGVERDWSFRDVEIRDGEVVNVRFFSSNPDGALIRTGRMMEIT